MQNFSPMKKMFTLTFILFSYYSFSQNEIYHAIQEREFNNIIYGDAKTYFIGEIKKNNIFSANILKYSVSIYTMDNGVRIDYIYKLNFLNIINKEYADFRIIYITQADIDRIYNYVIGEFVKTKKEESVAYIETTELKSGKLNYKYGLLVKFVKDNKGLFKVFFQQQSLSFNGVFPTSNMYSLEDFTKLFGKN